mmetsp:Transcript_29773/g.47411  ORF Transcript_29773/g.47411 Transcript_29773/m.47411 type:complete len:372 (-) Transcript_29773:3391-4506(-)
MSVDSDTCDPTLQNILDQESLQWIFVGGKGGVGKTTTSCMLSICLSQVRDKVLIVSTDPAHNLSDAFCQKFTHEPTLVNGFDNLFCMEIEPAGITADAQGDSLGLGEESGMQNMMKEIGNAMPGIDEAMSFTEIMKSVQKMDYSCIVFDTAPTGHTLRLLHFPTALQTAFEKIMELKNRFGGLLTQAASMMGGGGNGMENAMLAKLEETQKVIGEVNRTFKNPDKTTFVCVCIPEFLSVYETERLVQDLTKYDIDVHNIVVNQVLFAEPDACRKLLARKRMQDKYLDQIHDLYEDFNVVVMPQRDHEVRGVESLKAFSKFLINPYRPENTVDGVASSPRVVQYLCDKYNLDKTQVYKDLAEAGLTVPAVDA